MSVPLWAWLAFAVVVLGLLAVDLFAHRSAHVIGFRQAAAWSGVWVGVSVLFALVIGLTRGVEPAVQFGTAWLLEKSLSVDNLFVFAVIFAYFQVPRAYQHRVLFFGVLGALVFRGIFLAAGVAIVSQFTAVLFVFAALLIWSAIKLARGQDDTVDPGKSLSVRLLRKIVPISSEYHGPRFFIREAGKRVGTPLLAVVAAIEAADIVFAVDSVPAVLAVSDSAFIVYSSNAFAILGLRALYFLLATMLERFEHLSKALAFILAFIGVKLILQAAHKTISAAIPEIPSLASLAVILVALTAAIAASLRPARRAAEGPCSAATPGEQVQTSTPGGREPG
ncbi:MAG TPA: TerC family protein [Jatrophihabitans sp.]|nr:TerC family protein [Jatrophihabitans sp.]